MKVFLLIGLIAFCQFIKISAQDFTIKGKVVNKNQAPLEKIIVETKVNINGTSKVFTDTTGNDGIFTHQYISTNIDDLFGNSPNTESVSQAFPNPSGDVVKFKVNAMQAGMFNWRIHDTEPSLIDEGSRYIEVGTTTLSIPLKNYSSKVLIFDGTFNGKHYVNKFVHLNGVSSKSLPQSNSLSFLQTASDPIIEKVSVLGTSSNDYRIKAQAFPKNITVNGITTIEPLVIDETKYCDLKVRLLNVFYYETPDSAAIPNFNMQLLDKDNNVVIILGNWLKPTDVNGIVNYELPEGKYTVSPLDNNPISFDSKTVTLDKHTSIDIWGPYITFTPSKMTRGYYGDMGYWYINPADTAKRLHRYAIDPARAQETCPKFYIVGSDASIIAKVTDILKNNFMPYLKHPQYPKQGIIPVIESGTNPPAFKTSAANNYVIISTNTFTPLDWTPLINENVIDPTTGAITQSFVEINTLLWKYTQFPSLYANVFPNAVLAGFVCAFTDAKPKKSPTLSPTVLNYLSNTKRLVSLSEFDIGSLFLIHYLPVNYKPK